MYYYVLRSLDELVGESGILRLPSYIFDIFVFDDERLNVLRGSQRVLTSGGRVLITGYAGTGKTALMAMILKNMLESGYGIGYILEDTLVIGRDHEEEGVVIFYDDISRMNKTALRSLQVNDVGLLIGTIRTEEIGILEKKLGNPVGEVFEVFRINPMSTESLRQILFRMADKENISVNDDAVDIVISKAGSLPIYIWQVMRDLKMNRQYVLDREFAEKIPQGMLEYVDNILWRILDDHEEKYEILLTLRILADMPNHEMHQDLFNAVFIIAKERIHGGEIEIRRALLSDIFDQVTRYLLKTRYYSFRLPHDSWADVLEGKSRGIISNDISRINFLFPRDARRRIVKDAVELCEDRIIRYVRDEERKKFFYRKLKRMSISFGKRRVDAFRIINEALSIPRNRLRVLVQELSPMGEPIHNAISLAKYVIYSIIASAKIGEGYASSIISFERLNEAFMRGSRELNELSGYIDRLTSELSEEDAHSIMYIFCIATAQPAKSAYHLRKLLEHYGMEKIEQLIRSLLTNFMPYSISDIVLSAYWTATYLADRIMNNYREELKSALNRMDIIGVLQEINDIVGYEEKLGIRILKLCIDIVKRKLNNLNLSSKLEITRVISRLYGVIKTELLPLVKKYCILTPNELRLLVSLSMEDALKYLEALLNINEELLDELAKQQYANAFRYFITIDCRSLARFVSVIAKSQHCHKIIRLTEAGWKEVLGKFRLEEVLCLIKNINVKVDGDKLSLLAKIISNRLEEETPYTSIDAILALVLDLIFTRGDFGIYVLGTLLKDMIASHKLSTEAVEGLCIYILANTKKSSARSIVAEVLCEIADELQARKNYSGLLRLISTAARYHILDSLIRHRGIISSLKKMEDIPTYPMISLINNIILMGLPNNFVPVLRELFKKFIYKQEPNDVAVFIRDIIMEYGDKGKDLITNIAVELADYIVKTKSRDIFIAIIEPVALGFIRKILGERKDE